MKNSYINKRTTISIILATVCMFLSILSSAQNPEWKTFDPSNSGLSSPYLENIAIDTNNVKWIGTGTDGLIKFDGFNWTTYTGSNSPINNAILSIAVDNKNNKWFGLGGGGLAKCDDVNWTIYDTTNNKILYNEISCIAFESSGTVWLGLYDSGMVKFDGVKWTVFNTQNSGIPANEITSIAIDNQNVKWIGTNQNGLIKFDDTNWTNYTPSNSGYPQSYVKNVCVDKYGNKFISTGGSQYGLVKFDGIHWTTYTGYMSSVTGLKPFNPYKSIMDVNGVLWIITNGQGLIEYDGNTWTQFRSSNSGLPTDGLLMDIAIDKLGNKWIPISATGLVAYRQGGVILSTNEIKNEELSIAFYPNPASEQLHFELNHFLSAGSPINIEIHDILGNLVLARENVLFANTKYTFDVSDLREGFYTVALRSADITKVVKLIVKH